MSFSLSEYAKIDVDWGFAPYPTGGLTTLPHISIGTQSTLGARHFCPKIFARKN